LAQAPPGAAALIALPDLGLYASLVVRRHRADTESDYRDMASTAMAARDFEKARLAYDRLSRISQEKRGEYLFNMALCIGSLGREDEATALLPTSRRATLPVTRRPPVPRQSLLRETNATPDTVRTVELHLRHIIESGADPVEPRFLLGQIYMRQGRLQEARKEFLDVVPARNEAALPLAVVLRAQGDVMGAAMGRARRLVFQRPRRQCQCGRPFGPFANAPMPRDDPDFEKAMEVLETGWRQFSNPAYPPAIGNVCANWVRSLAAQNPDDLSGRLKIVQRGLQYAPQNEGLLLEVIALTRVQGPAADAAVKR